MNERETCPYHLSLHLFRMVRRSLCHPIACWILAQTSSLVTWSLYEMWVSCSCTSFQVAKYRREIIQTLQKLMNRENRAVFSFSSRCFCGILTNSWALHSDKTLGSYFQSWNLCCTLLGRWSFILELVVYTGFNCMLNGWYGTLVWLSIPVYLIISESTLESGEVPWRKRTFSHQHCGHMWNWGKP